MSMRHLAISAWLGEWATITIVAPSAFVSTSSD
ncbi:hypothetical protein QE379_002530 [Sphingomonas sp. SORGH_AS 879]|nr:hypothetical protein [Sphingomonas sp. SORGH_AS_0879]